jgi:hypothetical protein
MKYYFFSFCIKVFQKKYKEKKFKKLQKNKDKNKKNSIKKLFKVINT